MDFQIRSSPFILLIRRSETEPISVLYSTSRYESRGKVFLGVAKKPGVGTSVSAGVPLQTDHSTVPIPTLTGSTV
jgi:hypothetical protein